MRVKTIVGVTLLLAQLGVVEAKTPAIQLASEFDKQVILADYLVSEKLDGVRGRWDGEIMWTRGGNRVLLPSWFSANFPSIALDGELWMGRGTFDSMSSLVRTQVTAAEQWRKVRFMVFDVPSLSTDFASRYHYAQTHFSTLSPYLGVIEQYTLQDLPSLYDDLDAKVAQGAEGLILHRKQSLYIAARNNDVMKLKPYYDAEAVVIGYRPGQGKFSGMMGSLLVETSEGKRFNLGSGFTLAQRQAPPEIGAVVTYKYLGLTENGLPRFASFLRVRPRNE